MEKHSDNQASYSWWLDNHNSSHQSQWLQSTLAELDRKTKMILDIIEDNGDTFPKRAEMYYQKRPELIKMVEDIHKSYRVLANKYDQVRSESLRSSNIGSLSNSFRHVQHLEDSERRNTTGKLLEAAHSHSGPIVENPDSEFESSTSELVESLNSLLHNLRSADSIKKKPNDKRVKDSNNCNGSMLNNKNAGVDSRKDSLEREKRFSELRLEVSKLMEDNLCQQAELIRRNDEKRGTIKELGVHINRLMEENRMLKDSLASQKKSRISKFKGALFG